MTSGPEHLDASPLRPHEELALHGERVAAPSARSSFAIVLFVAIGIASGLVALFTLGESAGIDLSLPLTAAGVAVVCYLAATATGIRWMAWAWVGISTVIVVLAELVDVPRLLALVVTGAILAAIAFARRRDEAFRQTAVALVYLVAGTLAVLVDPRLGLAIAGLALAAHAAWDVVHVRRDAVVSRSLALWCIGIDLTVGIGCLAAALLV
ncbi:hypothetical protein ACFPER_09850 [Agromyces aurantiacus]|uniref:Lysoplasmalogenase n=1 Tax=Agromyces aurantiacus TaxID=165814 RepID=A0ABV9R729_9MICO|nr:hypothetical protein [Agromyces aurantiacus]MBM7503777.1 hypothetical protein [Agromyces aurantiacus]